jgi:hypothetical protein
MVYIHHSKLIVYVEKSHPTHVQRRFAPVSAEETMYIRPLGYLQKVNYYTFVTPEVNVKSFSIISIDY